MEQWLPIPGFEHCGEVSNLGRIRSRFGKIRKTIVSNTGYDRVGLKKIGGKNTTYVILHRLVALAFCPGFKPGLTVNHIDGNKRNNAASNLEWVTLSQNAIHAFKLKLRVPYPHKRIIPDEDRQALLAERAKGITYRKLAERYGVHHTSMYNFLNGRKHKPVTRDVA